MELNKMAPGMVRIKAAELKGEISKAPFTIPQIQKYLGRNSTFIFDAMKRGTMNEGDLRKTCDLLDIKAEDFIIPEAPKEEPKPQRPLESKNDAAQNWMQNTYRAVENVNDAISVLKSAVDSTTDAVRGERQTILEMVALMKEIKVLLGEIKVATESLRTSQQYSEQEKKKKMEKLLELLKYGRQS